MGKKQFSFIQICENWKNEFNEVIVDNNAMYIASFTLDKELLFINDALNKFVKSNFFADLLNPTFEKLKAITSNTNKIFEGYLTIGDYESVNPSFWARIYRKQNHFLLLGTVNTVELLEQNSQILLLNQEINSLQRDLLKEKYVLQKTLEDLSSANQELEKINATKDKLFSIIGHDLKSPVNNILGFSSLLIKKFESIKSDQKLDFAQHIYKGAASASKLLESILLWARAERGNLKPVIENLNLNALVLENIELLSQLAEEKAIEIRNHVDETYFVLSDKNMVLTIIRNLLSNAIKFTPNGGFITIEADESKKSNSFVEIRIIDNGVGMNKELSEQLFHVANNVSRVGTNNEKGTGLGLVICKDFVNVLGGEIWVRSELNKGSKFCFSLPKGNIASS